MSKKQKLELTWIGKENRPKLEPRILLEDPAKSYHAKHRVTSADFFDNRLIFGDNLLALKALEGEFSGKVKCVFIDPPYNTGSAFTHYDDGVEHSIWLSLMRDRLEIIKRLLSDDGSLWITIDDNEAHYLKVLCDEVFGRRDFVSTVIWEKKYAPKADSKLLSSSHDFVLVYAKNVERVKVNRLSKTEKQTSRYTNRDNDSRGLWKAGDTLRNEVRDYAVFPVRLPSGREVWPSSGTSWRYTKEKFAELIADNRIWFGVGGDARPAIKRFLTEVSETIPATTIWKYDEVGHNDEAKKESKMLFSDDLFGTPKPERLMQRIIELATDPGDLIVDSFAGSQVLIELGSPELVAQEQALLSQVVAPQMQRARLSAEQSGARTLARPAEWAAFSPEVRTVANAAFERHRREARGGAWSAYDARIAGYRGEITSLNRQESLLNEELSGMRTLAEEQLVLMTRVRALERNLAELQGPRSELTSLITSTQQERLRRLAST